MFTMDDAWRYDGITVTDYNDREVVKFNSGDPVFDYRMIARWKEGFEKSFGPIRIKNDPTVSNFADDIPGYKLDDHGNLCDSLGWTEITSWTQVDL